MAKNSSITAFFKPILKPSQPSSQPHTDPSPSRPQFRQPPQWTPTPLSPTSPAKLGLSPTSEPAVPSARDPNAVIRDSDDEDDDDPISSDDELPDLFKPALPVPPPRRGNACATPGAKRTALTVYSSPLTIMPKHKFDIKALMKHAEADEALEASALLMEQALAAKAPNLDAVPAPGEAHGKPFSLHDTMKTILSDAEDSQEESAHSKLLRAVQRTEATVHRPRFYFFKYEGPVDPDAVKRSIVARVAFPHASATGAWRFLADDKHRSEFFEDGIPFNIQRSVQNNPSSRKSLPDAIFLWVFQEVQFEKSKRLREQYLRLLSVCSYDQISRLVTKEFIDQLFKNMGASDRVFASPSKPVSGASPEMSSLYLDRDWTTLQSVLFSLTNISQGLSLPALVRSVSILLCLGMDNVMRRKAGVTEQVDEAFWWLADAVPDKSWDVFCGDVCTSLYNHAEEYPLRCDAASSIPLTSPRLVDLRRRLALVCIFDDPQWARTSPSESFSMRSIIDRLEADEFIVDRNHTDFVELAALAELLGLAIGDGNPPSTRGGSASANKQFNAEVDELTQKVKVMYSGIQGQGAAYASRLDAKLYLQDLERKLQNATRTRPPPRQSILGIDHDEDEVERPKQQRFMQRFLQSKSKQVEPNLP